ncbi:metal dependent phosphohydrolase [Thermincola ferriacetica]|uniref:Metal dependent phosphohydrolase n=1 Tax=Thermincola ferriacetica TaxID=281456 RepID=A0A0L6W223_9FIRM|nr:CRISPR-associated helicase/endonuclease Cas3 [Thermincola ferriacetica]KNZ69511.1 metal dependent phosphohydrolase [Thermincola ferriacetica]
MDFYSHFDQETNYHKYLNDHLAEVAGQMMTNLQDLPALSWEIVKPAVTVIGLGHDFGKYTTFFQDYLVKRKNCGALSYHGFISAVWTASHLLELQYSDQYRYIPLIGYMAVLHHHGNLTHPLNFLASERSLQQVATLCKDNLRNRLEIMNRQLDDLQKNSIVIDKEMKYLMDTYVKPGIYMGVSAFAEKVHKTIGKLFFLYDDLIMGEDSVDDGHVGYLTYLQLLYIYSLLIDADKKNAAGLEEVKRFALNYSIVEKYRKVAYPSPKKQVDFHRNEVYQRVMENMEQRFRDSKIFTITAPTGSGKTISGFAAALKLRELIKSTKSKLSGGAGISGAEVLSKADQESRIIYSLPFTSIIDQNYDVLKEMLEQNVPAYKDNKDAFLMKHHHLSEVNYKIDGENISLDHALLNVEAWNSEIIVTTFVQLFHTVFGYTNKMLKKFHRLAGSIILMDEVQSIPAEYWGAVRQLLKLMTEYLDCRIILMTATKPLIFEDNESIELAGNSEEITKLFKAFDRVTLRYYGENQTIDEFVRYFGSCYDPNKSYLLVMNTIKSSLELFTNLKQNLEGIAPIFYLSTNVTPKDRHKKLNQIKEKLKNREKVIIVSTQVVEAGVDIDVDEVFRDLAPIDSIIQCAGRCNRNKMRSRGTIEVVNLMTDNGQDYASKVYGPLLINEARDLLKKYPCIDEKDFGQMVSNYFINLVRGKRLSSKKSLDLLDAVKNLSFNGSPSAGCGNISEFCLIRELPFYVDVFIEQDEEAQAVWDDYETTVLSEHDPLVRRKNYMQIKAKLARYIISIPERDRQESNILGLQAYGRLYRLPNEYWKSYYDSETGFKRASLRAETFEIL